MQKNGTVKGKEKAKKIVARRKREITQKIQKNLVAQRLPRAIEGSDFSLIVLPSLDGTLWLYAATFMQGYRRKRLGPPLKPRSGLGRLFL